MIVLDTNVVSELMRGPTAERRVLTWVRSLRDTPVTTVITRAEILCGVALMPRGRRRDDVRERAEEAFAALGSLLPLVDECAPAYADVVARREGVRRPIDPMDALIAAICLVAGASLASRNARDFEGLGLDLLDPWAQT